MISVIIPSFRPGDYLLECLHSLNNQTLPKTEFEVIIVLNGEYNPYYGVLKQYKQHFQKLNLEILYSHEKGVSNARNVGIVSAKYDHIVFIDDDDLVSVNMLLSFKQLMRPDSIVVSKFQMFKTDISKTTDDYVAKAYNKCKDKKYNLFQYRGFLSSACGKLIPKSVIEHNRFNVKFKKGEDSLFMFCLSKNIKLISLAEEGVIYYRRKNSGSTTRLPTTIINEFINTLKLQVYYTQAYFANPLSYNIFLYLSRIAAVAKLFIKRAI